jgi:ribosomal protein L32
MMRKYYNVHPICQEYSYEHRITKYYIERRWDHNINNMQHGTHKEKKKPQTW